MSPQDGQNDAPEEPTLAERVRHRLRRARRVLEPPPPPQRDGASFARGVRPGSFAVERHGASRALLDRLGPGELAAVRERIEGDAELAASYHAAGDPAVAGHMLLAYGTWLGAPELAAATGLTHAAPPPDVHAMAHGPLAAAGGLYEADMVADALASVGVELAAVERALDFGCSSGRVLRVLAAAFPEVRWVGCDPNRAAIEWARGALPQIEWFTSANEPPLALGDGALELAYAISIWSHFEPAFGLRWLEEMHRVIRPGGHLVLTTHGWTALAFDAERDRRPLSELAEIERALYRDGCWFIDSFGPEGDWGVVNPRWGSAFVTPEFMLGQLCPRWSVVEFVAGRNQSNQDVYVLARA